MAKWFAVERRYVTRETAYVQARTAEEAKSKVAEGDFYDSEEPTIERYFAPGPAKRVNGIPRTMWEAAGFPDDIPIRTGGVADVLVRHSPYRDSGCSPRS